MRVGPIQRHRLAVKIGVVNYYYQVFIIILILKMSVMQSTMFMVITMGAVVLVVASLEDLVKFIVVCKDSDLPFGVLNSK